MARTANYTRKLNYQATTVLKRTAEAKTPIVINVGGTGSSKSYSVAQLICSKFIREKKKKILITRKTLPSLRITSYKVVLDMLKEWGVYDDCNHNKSERTIEYGSNWMIFTSIDDEKKIRSTEFNYIWAEEANEFSREELLQLTLRYGAKKNNQGELNQLFLTYNPSDDQAAAAKFEDRKDVTVIRSTYQDNPFLEEQKVQEVEGLKEIDDEYYRIYTLGQYARPTNIIYTNWDTVKVLPVCDDVFYGLDFGFNNPTALTELRFDGKEIWERELIYESKMTNAELIERMRELTGKSYRPIYADPAEPQRIEEISRAGFNVHPAEKGPDSIRASIIYVKQFKVHIEEDSVNLIAERRGYKWRTDRNGRVLDDPVPFRNHLMDAERYGIFTHMKDLVGEFAVVFEA